MAHRSWAFIGCVLLAGAVLTVAEVPGAGPHGVAASAARWVYNDVEVVPNVGFSPSPLFAVILAAVVYVGVNHLLIGQALVLARSVSWEETGVWQAENLLPDLIMLALGYAVALL